MARKTEDYAFWRASLKGEKPPIQAEKPQCGFYKRRLHRNSPWLPLAIWRNDDGELVCGFQGKQVDPVEQWSWVADTPVEEKAYRYHIEHGHWEDEPAPAAVAETAPGSNMPADPFSQLKAEVDSKLDQARELVRSLQKKEATELDASLARNLQAELLKLKKSADGMHETEKKPHLDAGRDVDAKFDFRKNVETAAASLRKIFEDWMKAEEARQKAEARKKFEAEQKKAEEARAAAEAERERLEADDPIMAAVTPVEVVAEPVFAPELVKINVGGGVGRKAGLKSVWEPVIEDYYAALNHYRDHADIRSAVEKLVKAQARIDKDSTKIPGVRMQEERKAA